MRLRCFQAFVALAALSLAAAQAQSMNAQAFYQKATALQGKRMMALFSGGEIKALTAEAQAAGSAARKERLAAVAAGKAPRYCPTVEAGKMSSSELIQRLGAIPTVDRSKINMTEAMTRVLAAKFPCPA